MSQKSKVESRKFGRQRRRNLQPAAQSGIILATLMAFLPLLVILSTIVIGVSLQAHRSAIDQQYKQQAQLAGFTAMDYAKEQYELDIDYGGTAETVFYTTNLYTVTYEVISKGYTNMVNTQQDIQGIGRVYKNPYVVGTSTPLYTREIQGKITHSPGDSSSARFIFVIDNSGSMDVNEWLDSKTTVDASINYVIDNAPNAEVAVVQYGTNHYSQEHKYDVTVQFTRDKPTATTWDRRFGPGSSAPADLQDHLPGSLAQMRIDSLYGPGDLLDLAGATDVQYVVFTDAWGDGLPSGNCCSHLKMITSDPWWWFDSNGSGYSVMPNHDEYNVIKDGTVFAQDGYTGLSAQFTILSINSDPDTQATSAAVASPGGTWTGAIDSNPGDPEGNGIVPRRFISTTLAAGPTEILSILQEIIEEEINF